MTTQQKYKLYLQFHCSTKKISCSLRLIPVKQNLFFTRCQQFCPLNPINIPSFDRFCLNLFVDCLPTVLVMERFKGQTTELRNDLNIHVVFDQRQSHFEWIKSPSLDWTSVSNSRTDNGPQLLHFRDSVGVRRTVSVQHKHSAWMKAGVCFRANVPPNKRGRRGEERTAVPHPKTTNEFFLTTSTEWTVNPVLSSEPLWFCCEME